MKSELAKTFIELIRINEVYGEEKKIIEYVTQHFQGLGIPHTVDKLGNIVCHFPGTGTPIMLNTHLDTPEKMKRLGYAQDGDIIRSTGKSILGADPKSGLAVLLELATFLKNSSEHHRPIEFVFTIGEEAGLIGARGLDPKLLKARTGLVLDEDGPCTNVVTRAPGYYQVDAVITGKTVHTRDWREGINAMAVAVKSLSKFKQGEITKGVTCNVGTLTTGTARNSVAGSARVQIELRSFNNAALATWGKKVEDIFVAETNKAGAKINIDGGLQFESYIIKRNTPIFKQLQKTFRKRKLSPNYYATFGGSDANIFNTKGIDSVAIGSGYYLAHQYDEYANLREMQDLLEFLADFVKN